MTRENIQAFSTSEFITSMIGKPWANRSCTTDAVDCWGLVVLYYRQVLGIELHQTPDYESGADFLTCYQGDVVFWQPTAHPAEGGLFVGYTGDNPTHVGLILGRQALHSRGENGGVRQDSLMLIERAFTKVEYLKYGAG